MAIQASMDAESRGGIVRCCATGLTCGPARPLLLVVDTDRAMNFLYNKTAEPAMRSFDEDERARCLSRTLYSPRSVANRAGFFVTGGEVTAVAMWRSAPADRARMLLPPGAGLMRQPRPALGYAAIPCHYPERPGR